RFCNSSQFSLFRVLLLLPLSISPLLRPPLCLCFCCSRFKVAKRFQAILIIIEWRIVFCEVSSVFMLRGYVVCNE
ncbi:hypothetical protein S83_062265, partial [Arachis hypogaea]